MVRAEPTSLFQPAKVISSAENQQVNTIHSISPLEGPNLETRSLVLIFKPAHLWPPQA